MSELRRCPQCDAEIPANSPAGLCPQCLLRAMNDSQSGAAFVELGPTKLTPPNSGFVPPTVQELAERLPQLEILELLGKGGMGAVYKARQRQLDRLVAVKILPPEISRDPAFAERFQREARALAKLSHPHIVAVYDFGQTKANGGCQPPSVASHESNQGADAPRSPIDSSLCYIIMEFVDGANLRQTIRNGALKPAEALAIVPQICEALQFAHDEGVVHRDIKPENILIDKRGRVKIADFGLAKLMANGGRESLGASLTATHQVMGTLRYMAPEQMQGSREVDHRADIYSLGVVFYELLTGELPMGKFAPPSKKVQVDVRLDEVVLRALEQDPEQRYQHASDVKTEIDTISRTPLPARVARPESSMGVESRPAVTDTPFDDSGRDTRPWSKTEITTAAAVGVAFALAAVKGIFEMSQRPSPLDNVAMFVTAVATIAVVVLLVLQQLGRTNGSRAAMPGFYIAVLAACAGSLPWTAVFSPIAGWLFWQGAAFASLNFLLSLGLLIAGEALPRMRAIGLLIVGLISFGLVISFDIGPVGVIGSNFLGRINTKPGLPGEFLAAALGVLAMIAGALQLRNQMSEAANKGTVQPTWLSNESRFSRFAIAGAVWAIFGLLTVIPVLYFIGLNRVWNGTALPTDVIHSEPPLVFTIFMGALLAIGAGAPIGTTIFGSLAIGHIKRSEGRIIGLPLAFANAMFFPLLAAVAGIAVPCALALRLVLPLQLIAAAVPSVGLAACISFFIARAVWRTLGPQLSVDDRGRVARSESATGVLLSAQDSGEPGGVSPRTSNEEVRGLTPPGSPSLPVQRPKLVPVLATMNLLGAIVLMLVSAMEQPPAFAPSSSNVWQVWEIVDSVLGFTMAAGMFAASIGLFLWKPWARKLTLGVCVFGLSSFVFDAPYLARFGIPELYAEIQQTITEEGIEPGARDFVAMFTVVVLIGGTMVVGLTWLIGQLVYFTRPRVAAAFASSNETPSRFVEWLFTGAGAVVGVLSVFGPLALLLGIASLMDPGKSNSRLDELAPPPSLGTISNGIGAEFRVPAGQVVVLEIVTRRDGETVPVPPHCGYVIAPSDRRLAATFRWLRAWEQPLKSDGYESWNLEIKTAGGGGGFSGGLLLPKDLSQMVGSMGITSGDLAPNEEVIHWGTHDANNLPDNGLIGLRFTVTAHELQTSGGSGNGHIDWKKAHTATSTTRRKLPVANP